MKFKDRLLRYLIGFGIGMILVNVFFGERGWGNWLPGNQVKKRILEKNPQVELSSKASCQMTCQDLIIDDIEKSLGEEGEVVFSESQVDAYPYEYVIASQRENMAYKFGFIVRQDSSSIVSFAKRTDKEFECDCE